MDIDFSGVDAKLLRAKEHLDDLGREWNEFHDPKKGPAWQVAYERNGVEETVSGTRLTMIRAAGR